MKLAQILFCQGFGTRRDCEGLVHGGHVRHQGQACHDTELDLPTDGLVLQVRGQDWPFHAQALLMLHKPTGVECSQKPKHHPSVYTLLPGPLRHRDVQSIGRLDADTTGLLLFTDDGTLLHKLTSPKHHVPKVYEVGCKHPVTPDQVTALLKGVKLVDDPATVAAAAAEPTGERADGLHGLRMTLVQGKYHQVKRMMAAVGNRVEQLHRSQFGPLSLPSDLAPGQWRWLDASQIDWKAAPSATPARAG
ncbi:MAG: 16S rRNA pseudouridine(516) synthase [Pseudomonadota bacterium]